MAVINILAKGKNVNWLKVSNDAIAMNLSVVEVFPIPKELGFDDDALAVNVHKGYTDKRSVLAELSVLVQYLVKHNFTVTELYDGIEIIAGNMLPVFDCLLS